MDTDNAIDFAVIEQHKENIQPSKDGRSAAALKELLTKSHDKLKSQLSEERSKLEDSLLYIEELDDPIQPFLDYIHWTITNYPSGVTVESGLIQVLERCTSQFRDTIFYKSDPRYLKVWLTYAKYSENPRDIFVYLARKEIGKSLATYYEEYANYLEINGRRLQAEQVYLEGIKQQARPFQRLSRRFEEFKLRTQSLDSSEEPQSPVFPVRTALSIKSGGTLFSTIEDTKTEKSKLEIFNDTEEGGNDLITGGWDSLGTSQFRNKENKLEAKPWSGEVFKQKSDSKQWNKVPVFKDDSNLSSEKIYKIIETQGKRTEKIDINFDLLYRDDGEYCIQEVLATMKNNYSTSPIPHVAPQAPLQNQTNETIHLSISELKRKASPTATVFTKEAKDEILSMFNQRTIDSNDHNKPQNDNDDEELIYGDYTENITHPNFRDLTEKVREDVDDLEIDNKDELLNTVCIVNPADDSLREALLDDLSPPIHTYSGLHNYTHPLSMCSTLKKSLNYKQTKSVFLDFDGNTFNLKSLLGEGGYASVYLAESMTGGYKAIKAQKPSSAWEFYILKRIETLLQGNQLLDSIIKGEEIHVYEDESYLILDYIKQGTILDVVNLYKANGKNVDEVLVAYITCELLKVVEALHSIGIMHSDLKPDNCMISSHGIKLIDFGRSIDMTLFPRNVQFKSNWRTDNQDCPEMRQNETWTYQVDYFGIAGIVHTMLYGHFIETTFDGFRHRLANPIKRYWQQDLWYPLFDILMNSSSFGELPITNKVREQRLLLENWLSSNRSKLLPILKDVEVGFQ